ncbi:MAG: hypothetical protein PF450_11335 [Bacteroidales bacterium]|nr:hypothetical protein [Bacteroidales bacterium]
MMRSRLFIIVLFGVLMVSCNSKEPDTDMSKLELVVDSIPFEIIGDNYIKSISIRNGHESEDLDGKLTIRVKSNNEDSEVYKSKSRIVVAANSETDHIFTFSAPQVESYKIEYSYRIKHSPRSLYKEQGAPYILTPEEPSEPQINGLETLIVRARSSLYYAIPFTGARPMTYEATGLPEGVVFDSIKGSLQGAIRNEGVYPMTLIARNSLGKTSKIITFRIGDSTQIIDTVKWTDWLGWDPSVHSRQLSVDEQYALVSLRSLQSAPVILKNIAGLDDFTKSLLTNNEVLALNLDVLSNEAVLVYDKDSIQVWIKDLSDGSKAVGFFNMDEKKHNPTIDLNTLGLSGTYAIRDLWRQENIGETRDEIKVHIYPHGVFLTKLTEK